MPSEFFRANRHVDRVGAGHEILRWHLHTQVVTAGPYFLYVHLLLKAVEAGDELVVDGINREAKKRRVDRCLHLDLRINRKRLAEPEPSLQVVAQN